MDALPPKTPDTMEEELRSAIEDAADISPEDVRVASLMEHTIDVPVLASAVEQQEAADAADTLEALEEEEAAEVLHEMEDHAAAEALAEMETPIAASVVEDLIEDKHLDYAARLSTLMAPDDAADMLQAMPEDQREDVLVAMPLDRAIGLRRLIGYDEESAAGLMTTDFVALRREMTVGEATDVIRGRDLPEGINDLIVTEDNGRVAGRVSLRDLLIRRDDLLVEDVMNESVPCVRPDLDQEAVAREFDRYDYAMMPVVDEADRVLGIITFDDVIDIIRAEQTEDVQKTVGAGGGEAVYSSIGEKFKGRFPWLGISLVMTCLAAMVVLFFEELIQEHTILAFLLPVLAAVVGNAGHQALAVTLRGIVLDEVRKERISPLIVREGVVGVINGISLGVVVALLIGLASLRVESASWMIGIIAGAAMAIAMSVGTLAGSGIPLLMRRVGFDPAQSSAIFLIMITDALSFSSLLLLTFTLLGA